MRRTIATMTGLLLLATAAPAAASAGLPKLATLHLGAYEAVLSASSPALHTGSNTFTLAIPDLPAGSHVIFTALGPDGKAVDVDLAPLTVLAGADHEHAAAATHADAGAMSEMSGMSGMSHDAAPSAGGYIARGSARLSQTGTWTLLVEASDGHRGTSDKVALPVVPGGPSRLYLSVTGALMGGFLIYGAIERRRKPAGGR